MFKSPVPFWQVLPGAGIRLPQVLLHALHTQLRRQGLPGGGGGMPRALQVHIKKKEEMHGELSVLPYLIIWIFSAASTGVAKTARTPRSASPP